MGFIRRIGAGAVATFAAAGLAIGLAAPASAALSSDETNEFLGKLTATYNDPVETANDNNPYDFDIVTKAALVTGATNTLAGLDKFTLFAPNDRAFEALANDLGLLGKNYRFSAKVDEKRVFEAIAGLGIPTVTEVLLYHVVPNAKVTGKDVLSGPFSQRISMANGEKLRVTVLSRSARFPVILLGDKDGKFFNDSVVRSKINAVETDNTVVHGISGVLLPTL
ncbi:MAG: fasciclin domain-containing protein [Actinobacteria bacterium]|nr:fasciclin domain-containing protein [Micrococcales bacterium]MCB9429583.1 fasciclin domain-containing protein [Actinomycetota bacterium]MCO5300493.1 fasciclin domain-containing protein [Candidatus Nanopelagicales bacterium]HPJ19061.1 fasciclin domain-containing protein [Actinomycetota bacterium]HRV65305.1 fasciclin domain-containing protein [Candidatus Nanopelagicales bacterium]